MTSDVIYEVTEEVERDTIGPMLNVLAKENARARSHELGLFSIMFSGQTQHPISSTGSAAAAAAD